MFNSCFDIFRNRRSKSIVFIICLNVSLKTDRFMQKRCISLIYFHCVQSLFRHHSQRKVRINRLHFLFEIWAQELIDWFMQKRKIRINRLYCLFECEFKSRSVHAETMHLASFAFIVFSSRFDIFYNERSKLIVFIFCLKNEFKSWLIQSSSLSVWHVRLKSRSIHAKAMHFGIFHKRRSESIIFIYLSCVQAEKKVDCFKQKWWISPLLINQRPVNHFRRLALNTSFSINCHSWNYVFCWSRTAHSYHERYWF